MDHKPSFVDQYLNQALSLSVEEPLFSKGTYQLEVVQPKKKSAFPFLQMNDRGELTNFFCSCKVSDSGMGCPHLAAGYLRIFNGEKEPLHVRFAKSFWAKLFQILHREGKEPNIIAKSPSAENRVKNPRSEEEKSALISLEEMSSYKAGNLSPWLSFELSPLSDLAKWLMHLQEIKTPYEVRFLGTHLPNQIEIEFPEIKILCPISKDNWPYLIASLSTIQSPLKILDSEGDAIESLIYDEKTRSIRITRKQEHKEDPNAIDVGDWVFVPNVGFHRKRNKSILELPQIPADQIAQAFEQSLPILQKFLPVFPDKRTCRYHLFFDENQNLHIELYVESPGETVSAFFPWAHVQNKGFYLLDEWFFEGEEKIVPCGEVSDFVTRNQSWLHNFAAFQVNLSSFEPHLDFTLTKEGLSIDAKLDFPEEEALHFDQWIYLKGQGFYKKKETRGRLFSGTFVPKESISSFIDKHKDDLEQIEGFFSNRSLVLKMGLDIFLNEEGKIIATPKMECVEGPALQRFGNYVYSAQEGFSEVPPTGRLPERYQSEMIISAFDLETLRPFALTLDPRLEKPEKLHLKVQGVRPARKQKGRQWWLCLSYQSDQGSTDLFSLWDAYQAKQPYLFSEAGLIDMKDPRFFWVRQIKRKNLDREKGWIKLNTMEWIRLSAIEKIEEPKNPKMQEMLSEISRFDTVQSLDITSLKSTLRPYQEQGLHWLWFLYCHGLSGLLCDDMGLGKTHQTMALLAAISNEDEEKSNKYLVVCPTSVIYHWQELLKRFLPHIRVCTYYGMERSLEHFETDYDLVLTSYGILRSGKKKLKEYEFEVAIFDEIQIAKNHASQTHKALRSIQAQMRLGLTGTPIENRLRELKSLFDIVLPSYLPSESHFREEFIHPIEKEDNEEKKHLLGKLVKPFILRRKKNEVLTDLPEKIEEIAYADLSQEQADLYRNIAFQMKDTVYQDLKDPGKPVSFVHIFSSLSVLKQICDHPSLVLDDLKNYKAHSSGKWDLFVELLSEALGSGQKVVVFSQYLGMLQIIESYLKKQKIGYASIKGATRDRAEQLRSFRDDPNCSVFVASLLAAGVGIDLTSASIVIHYDRWWNPAKENQATDRVHRIGQNRGVQVFKLVTKETIEEHIHDMIERKKGLLEDIIGHEDQINYLTRDDLLKVFEKMFTSFS